MVEAETLIGQNCPEGLTESAAEAKRLLRAIREEIDTLRKMIFTEEELQKIRKTQEDFDQKMQVNVYAIRYHLDSYRQEGWRELACEGEHDNE
jgi:hypothetical protein